MKNSSIFLSLFVLVLLTSCSQETDLFDFDDCDTAALSMSFSETGSNSGTITLQTDDRHRNCDLFISESEVSFFDDSNNLLDQYDLGNGDIGLEKIFQESITYPNNTGKLIVSFVNWSGDLIEKPYYFEDSSGNDNGNGNTNSTAGPISQEFQFYGYTNGEIDLNDPIDLFVTASDLHRDENGFLSGSPVFRVRNADCNQDFNSTLFKRIEYSGLDATTQNHITEHGIAGFPVTKCSYKDVDFIDGAGSENLRGNTKSIILEIRKGSSKYRTHIK